VVQQYHPRSTSNHANSLFDDSYVYHDGLTVISGDSSGYLKTWDMRTGKVLQAILNEPTKKPISHLAISKQRGALDGVSLAETEEPESRWLAVNSYDNGTPCGFCRAALHVGKKSHLLDENLIFTR
jgi:WD40 repeat protein